ncbi:MAG: HEAT repeat domain-containing protein [Anaerolineae bacterium]|nr:HEAT repeat domain-containing protein [Anaerolineae bacterium]
MNSIENGRPPLDTLLIELGSQDPRVRETAARKLGHISDRRATEPLIDLLFDENGSVRVTAINALGFLRDERAIDPLLNFIKADEWWIRRDVVKSLGRIGDSRSLEPLLQTLSDSNIQVRESAMLALGGLKDKRAVEPLLKIYKASGNTYSARALALIGDASVLDTFLEALEDERPLYRLVAIEVIDSFKDERAVKPLSKLLYDEDEFVAGRAAYTLGKLGDEGAVGPLLNALVKVNETKTKIGIIASLGKLPNSQSVDPLIKILDEVETSLACEENHLDIDLGCAAAASLGLLGDKRAYNSLIRSLNNPDPNNWIRPFAAVALGRLGDKQAFEHIVKLLDDEYVVHRIAAVEGLGYLGDAWALVLLKQIHDSDDGVDEFGISVRETAEKAIEWIEDKA